MCIERAFGKFKSQWRLFHTGAPRLYPAELTNLLLAAVVLHNVTIDIDGAGWHPSYKYDENNKVIVDPEHDIAGSDRDLETFRTQGTTVRDEIADQLPMLRAYRSAELV